MPTLNEVKPYEDSRGNRIVGTPSKQEKCRVIFGAQNCSIEIGAGVTLQNLQITMEAPNSTVRIGAKSIVKGWIRAGLNSSIIIGSNLWMTGLGVFSACEETSVEIGDDCMFASGNEIRADDGHPIFDIMTGKRTNPSQSVKIGNHVWLAPRSVILPGSEVGDGSIIGYGSMVLGARIPANVLAVGTPARVVRTGIVWDKKNVGKHPPFLFDHISDLGEL